MRTKAERRDDASSSMRADHADRQDAPAGSAAFDDLRPQALAQREKTDLANAGRRMGHQRMIASAIQRKTDDAAAPNRTGLPDQLRAGIESLSGISMDGVKVHYNSSQPAQLDAHAYAQGTDIHIAPGQEQHLPHEAWHIVQQAQGRVKPTMQMRDRVLVNDEDRLEREADEMGARALQLKESPASVPEGQSSHVRHTKLSTSERKDASVQRHSYRNTRVVKKEGGAFRGQGGAEVSAGFNDAIKAPIRVWIETPATMVTANPFVLFGSHLIRRAYGGSGDVPNILLWSGPFENGTWANQIEGVVETDLTADNVQDMRAELAYAVTGEDSDALVARVDALLVARGASQEAREAATILRRIPNTVNVQVQITKFITRDDDDSETTESVQFGQPTIVAGAFTAADLGVPVAESVVAPPVAPPPVVAAPDVEHPPAGGLLLAPG